MTYHGIQDLLQVSSHMLLHLKPFIVHITIGGMSWGFPGEEPACNAGDPGLLMGTINSYLSSKTYPILKACFKKNIPWVYNQ